MSSWFSFVKATLEILYNNNIKGKVWGFFGLKIQLQILIWIGYLFLWGLSNSIDVEAAAAFIIWLLSVFIIRILYLMECELLQSGNILQQSRM